MAFTVDDDGRIGRRKYWILSGLITLAMTVLIGGVIMAVVNGAYFVVGLLLLLVTFGVGLYFRVVMMRRCRDIGWSPALPWIFMGVAIFANFDSISSAVGGAPEAASFGLAFVIALADFGFAVLIGLIPGKSRRDYEAVFGPEPGDPGSPRRLTRPAARGEPEHEDEREARWDVAIQQALNARSGGATGATAAAPRAPLPRQSTFGRKPVC